MYPTVSIIIPVYRAPPGFLQRCLESAVAQTGILVEIIAVDDASPDACPAILDDFAARDCRFVAIHRSTNGRAGLARNDGLDRATGDFILFADADDTMRPDICGRLAGLAQKYDADIVACSWADVTDNGKVIRTSRLSDRAYDLEQPLGRAHCFRTLTFALWNKLFRREAMNGLRFEPFSANIGEDTLFNVAALCRSRRLVTTSYIGYEYTVNRESATHRKTKGMPYLETIVQSQKRIGHEIDAAFGHSGRKHVDWLAMKRYITGCEWIGENPDLEERSELWQYWRRYFIKELAPSLTNYRITASFFRLLVDCGNIAAAARLMRLATGFNDRLMSLTTVGSGQKLPVHSTTP